ncbi:PAS domain-containing protein [uncultured Bilophila sp.]|uniref:PAS domain-containing protein n=1 Tax=uncultured Bilophila sp. TaxID=529385 RepID=UPI00262ED653|nr:PAS domain-containing protein [uncultured Bilophila sp.]
MQTTGLFSPSPNVRRGNSFLGTLGAALVLVFGVVLVTGLSLDRSQTAMVRFLAEKGVALITALESGVRSGTRSRTGIRLQYLVEELADRPDVRFIAVTMPDGTILAHSNPARVGEVLTTLGGRELVPENIAALGTSASPAWTIMNMEGSRSFVVFKTFHPRAKGERRAPGDEAVEGPLPFIFLGLDLAPLEVAQAQNRERAVLLGAGVLLAGMLALLGLHAVERVRASRRGQRVAEALAEELAVALPDGLVVFDARGRITRLNRAALDLLGMEAPAKGRTYQGRKAADVLPAALADLAGPCGRTRKSPSATARTCAISRFAEGMSTKATKAASVRSCSCAISPKSVALRPRSGGVRSWPRWAIWPPGSRMSCAIPSAPSRATPPISGAASRRAAPTARPRRSWSARWNGSTAP